MQDIIEVNRTEKVADSKKGRKHLKFGRSKLPWLLLVIVLVGGLAGTYYYKKQADKVKSDPASVQKEKNQAETDRVLSALTKVILIEETDKPTVARVDDPEKLKKSNETFYKNIQQNDYLVIYPKRAIIYRESNNQIINVAPIINTSDLQKKQAEQSQQKPAETTTSKTKN